MTTQQPGGTVVVGFDAGDSARDALIFGARLAAAIGGTTLVAAVHPASPAGAGHVDAEWVAALQDDAEQRLNRARELLGDVPAEYRTVPAGSPAHGLDDLADSVDATAIVVGSARGGPLRRMFAGSTADRLLQGASVPVVVTPRGCRPGFDEPVSTIGCGFIDTRDGHEALRFAAGLAERAHARLRVLTVVAHPSEFSLFGARDIQRQFAEAARADFSAALDKAVDGLTQRVSATGDLLTGDAVDALSALDDRDLDLLICGSRGYGPLRRVLLGGTSSRLVRSAAAPVMVVPRAADWD